jgi:RNA polymerase sigma-70 factor (ECF subfamily)
MDSDEHDGAFSHNEAIERVFRDEHAKIFAWLACWFGLEAAEDAVQDAYEAALRSWVNGLPERPAAWLHRAAVNAAVSRARRDSVAARKAEEYLARTERVGEEHVVEDERLRLVFTCCHPALALEARVALTLQLVCGLRARAIARLFLLPEATIAQRLTRAKTKIHTAGIAYELPREEDLEPRLASVLAVVYLLFTEGHSSKSDDAPVLQPALCQEAIRLGRALVELVPWHEETRALLALMLLHYARQPARFALDGRSIPLEEQDRSRWDGALIAEGTALATSAGPYGLQARVAALHANAPSFDATDWKRIAELYGALYAIEPSPAIAVARVVAEAAGGDPAQALAHLDELEASGATSGFDRVVPARAELLRRAGRFAEAKTAYERALRTARTDNDRAFFERRRDECAARSDERA